MRVEDDAVLEGQPEVTDCGVAPEVLVREEEDLARAVDAAGLVEGHSSAVRALEDVQIVPPCRPVKALIAAEEFM